MTTALSSEQIACQFRVTATATIRERENPEHIIDGNGLRFGRTSKKTYAREWPRYYEAHLVLNFNQFKRSIPTRRGTSLNHFEWAER
jgi:hypothetical protein